MSLTLRPPCRKIPTVRNWLWRHSIIKHLRKLQFSRCFGYEQCVQKQINIIYSKKSDSVCWTDFRLARPQGLFRHKIFTCKDSFLFRFRMLSDGENVCLGDFFHLSGVQNALNWGDITCLGRLPHPFGEDKLLVVAWKAKKIYVLLLFTNQHKRWYIQALKKIPNQSTVFWEKTAKSVWFRLQTSMNPLYVQIKCR